MGGYNQFCPVSKAMELLDERWTLLVIREMIMGSRHFNDIRRGVPRMSPALLVKRLQRLERAGVVERHAEGNRVSYQLTPAGKELESIIDLIGEWGLRWVPELGDEDLDPHLLMWDMRRQATRAGLPPGRTVIQFQLRDVTIAGSWWLVLTEAGADACDYDPGFPITVSVETSLLCLSRIWRGDLSWREALRCGDLAATGRQAAVRAVPRWLNVRETAADPRPSFSTLVQLASGTVR